MEKYLAVKYDNPRILLRDFENLENQEIPVIATDFDDRYLIRFPSIYAWSLKVKESDIIGFEVTDRNGRIYEKIAPRHIPYLWKGIDAIYKNSMNSKYMACMKTESFKLWLDGRTYMTNTIEIGNIFNLVGTENEELLSAIETNPLSMAPIAKDMYDKGYFEFWSNHTRWVWGSRLCTKFYK